MSDSVTTVYGFVKPEIGGSSNTWGDKINADLDSLDAIIAALDNAKADRTLSNLASYSTARTNLGLGNSATRNVGTGAGTVAAGDDARIAVAVPSTRTLTAGTGLAGGGTLAANRSFSVVFGSGAGEVVQGNDSRMTNAREWTAVTISKAEAEEGVAVVRRAWTAERVKQAIIANAPVGLTTSTDQDETNFAIGTTVVADIDSPSSRVRNMAVTVRINPSNNRGYWVGGSGTALLGTWVNRGEFSAGYCLVQRIA